MKERVKVGKLIELLSKRNWDVPVSVVFEREPGGEREEFNITGITSNSKHVELFIKEGE